MSPIETANIAQTSLDIYTDGSYRQSFAGSGVWWGPNDLRNISTPCPFDVQGASGAELYAVVAFLEQIGAAGSCDQVPAEITRFDIRTDCFFVITTLDICRPSWNQFGWHNQSHKPISYMAMVRYIDALIENARLQKGIEFTFNYVPAHRSIEGNEAADTLAGMASRRKTFSSGRIWAQLEYAVRGFMAVTMLTRGVSLTSPEMDRLGKRMLENLREQGLPVAAFNSGSIFPSYPPTVGVHRQLQLGVQKPINEVQLVKSVTPGPILPSSLCAMTVLDGRTISSSKRAGPLAIIANHLNQPALSRRGASGGKSVAPSSELLSATPMKPSRAARKRKISAVDADLAEESAVERYLLSDDEDKKQFKRVIRPLSLSAFLKSPSWYKHNNNMRQGLPVAHRKQLKALATRLDGCIPNFHASRASWPEVTTELICEQLIDLLKLLTIANPMPMSKKRKVEVNKAAVPIAMTNGSSSLNHVLTGFNAVLERLIYQVCDASSNASPPLTMVLVCRDEVLCTDASLLDYLPHLVQYANQRGSRTILISLPKGAKKMLRDLLPHPDWQNSWMEDIPVLAMERNDIFSI